MDDVNIDYFLESPKGRCLEKHVRVNFPELYDKIKNLQGTKFSEKIYRYFNPNIKNECIICGRPTKFRSIMDGFSRTCCVQCAVKDPNRKIKAEQTCLERYGVSNPSQSDTIKRKKEDTCMEHYGFKSGLCNRRKIEQTCLERYGVSNPSQSDTIKRKKEDTCMEHYGVSNPSQSGIIRRRVDQTKTVRYGDKNFNNRQKAEQTMRELYGVKSIFNIPSVFKAGLNARLTGDAYQKVSQNNIKRCLDSHPDIIRISEGTFVCRCPHPECTKCNGEYKITPGNYSYRTKCGAEKCTILNPIGKSNSNTSIERFVEQILHENNINFEKHNRTILNGRELDFYIPNRNIAIECNGCYWHSDNFKPKNYHHAKYADCLRQGIQLITIWEDQVLTHPEQVRAILQSKFCIYKTKLRAHKCHVREISTTEARNILQYHMQGAGQASIRLGLYYNDELCSVMTFSKSRSIYGGNPDGYELIRYCCKPGIMIYGGPGKLLKYFISHFKPSKIDSFSSNDISIGHLYEALGFEKKSESLSYWYIEPNTFVRKHRYVYRKSELIKLGHDVNCSEFEITNSMGLYRIWDSGQTRWQLLLNS